MQAVRERELLEAAGAAALDEDAATARDPDVAVLVGRRSHHAARRQAVAGEMPAVAVRDHDHAAGVPRTCIRSRVRSAVDATVACVRWSRVHAGACVDSGILRGNDVLRSAAALAARDRDCDRRDRGGRHDVPAHPTAPCRWRPRPCTRRAPRIRPACAGWRRRRGCPCERWRPAHWRASCRTSHPGSSRSRTSRPLWRP